MNAQAGRSAARFRGRGAVVTGAGSGMGAAIARALCAEGAAVVAVDRDRRAVEAVADELRGAGHDATARELDVSDVPAVEAFGEEVSGRAVDVLCNNAGVLDDYATAHETPPELWARILGVNLTGAYLMARAIVPGMLERGAGAVVNTASIAAFVGGGGGAAYTASKHGLLGLTRQMAFDYGRRGVRVNAICPGAVATGMTTHLRTDDGANAHVDAAIAATPAGRWGEPEEVAALALFLASDEASFIHGTPVLVDGGWTVA